MKQVCLIAIALCLALSSYGQLVTFGPKIGISHSSLTEEDAQEIAAGDASVGFHAGLFARVSVLGFYVQPEALFTSSGGQIRYTDPQSNLTEVKDMTYNKIDVPIMLGFKIGPLFRVNAGPSFSMLLNADAREDGTVDEVKDNYKDATVGFQAGIGMDISKVTFDLRYENNLSAFGEEVTFRNQTFDTDLRNQLWVFTLGYKLF
uniref:Porin family protein n=1 Tax=Roseihalotalea indica TaxID=2867963 RepID=A0AA49GSW0_9BACT|nr:porin family protein [Tunicatimonas sp. TK19036]